MSVNKAGPGNWIPAGAGMTDNYKLAKSINFSNNKRET
jgi:hypothetical protein